MNCSPPGSSVLEISQARTLGWIAISFSRESSWPRDWSCAVLCLVAQSCPTVGNSMDCSLPCSSVHGDSPGKNNGVGFQALLQGIFPTQRSNPSLLNFRRILYHLSHQGSPRILGWVAHHFSRVSSWPRNWTRVSCIAGGFFTNWAVTKYRLGLFLSQFWTSQLFHVWFCYPLTCIQVS